MHQHFFNVLKQEHNKTKQVFEQLVDTTEKQVM